MNKEAHLKKEILIGVDFGGTKILTGAMTENGKVLGDPVKIPTNSAEKPEMIVDSIVKSVDEMLKRINAGIDAVKGIGLGVTGPLDITNGVILECPQLPTMHFFPLKKAIEEHFPVPVFMNNDANCLIYGEALFGGGIGKDNVVGFTGSAGEIWCSPYGNGTIEDFVCGSGVSRIYKEISGDDKSSLEIALLAENSDINALKTWELFGKHLAVAMAWTINLIDPEMVILGGSIANAQKFFIPSLESNLRNHICPVPA
jgi:glucokinase